MWIFRTNKVVNPPLLQEQVSTLPGFLRVQGRREDNNTITGEIVFENELIGTNLNNLQTIVTNHNANQLTADQQAQAIEQAAIDAENADTATFIQQLTTFRNNTNTYINTANGTLTIDNVKDQVRRNSRAMLKLIERLQRVGILPKG